MIKVVHRWLGLTLGVLWLTQALTGVAVVFRWELDDATLPGPAGPADPVALGARIDALESRHGRVSSVWASGKGADRFDIFYSDAAGSARTMRVDGAGRILRDVSADALVSGGGIFNTLSTIHENLFAGDTGAWIIGLSGLVLLGNLVFGLRLAWPRKGMWKRSMLAAPRGPTAGRLQGWHRLLGLWLALPAAAVVAAGALLAFEDGVEEVLHAVIAPPAAHVRLGSAAAGAQKRVGPGTALALALREYPGATVSALAFPSGGEPWYRIRLRARGEMTRIWGATTLFVSQANGEIVGGRGSIRPLARRFVDALYPVHTGQIGGIAGRCLVGVIGILLVAMIALGTGLWLARRGPERASARAYSAPQASKGIP